MRIRKKSYPLILILCGIFPFPSTQTFFSSDRLQQYGKNYIRKLRRLTTNWTKLKVVSDNAEFWKEKFQKSIDSYQDPLWSRLLYAAGILTLIPALSLSIATSFVTDPFSFGKPLLGIEDTPINTDRTLETITHYNHYVLTGFIIMLIGKRGVSSARRQYEEDALILHELEQINTY